MNHISNNRKSKPLTFLLKNSLIIFIFINLISCKTNDSVKISRFYNYKLCKHYIDYLGVNIKVIFDTVLLDLSNEADTVFLFIESNSNKKAMKIYAFNSEDSIEYNYNTMIEDSIGSEIKYMENCIKKSFRFRVQKTKISQLRVKETFLYRVFFENYFFPNPEVSDFFTEYLIVKVWFNNKNVKYEFYTFDRWEILRTPNYIYKKNSKIKGKKSRIRYLN